MEKITNAISSVKWREYYNWMRKKQKMEKNHTKAAREEKTQGTCKYQIREAKCEVGDA